MFHTFIKICWYKQILFKLGQQQQHSRHLHNMSGNIFITVADCVLCEAWTEGEERVKHVRKQPDMLICKYNRLRGMY